MLSASQSSSAAAIAVPRWDDADDFRAMYTQHAGFVWANLRRLGVPPAEVEDAVQEVFVTVHRRADALAPDAALRGWLYAILRRVAFRKRRTLARRGRLHDALAQQPAAANSDPSRQYDGREAVALVEEFLAALDPRKREIFVLAELERMTAREIASWLRMNPNTVSSRLRAARQAFDRHFARLRGDERRAATAPADALRATQRAQRPNRRQRATAFGGILSRLESTAHAQPIPWTLATWGTTKVFATTIAIGLLGLAGAHLISRPEQGEPTNVASRRSPTPPVSRTATTTATPPAVFGHALRSAADPPTPLPPIAPIPTLAAAPLTTSAASPAAMQHIETTTGSALAAEAALVQQMRAARDGGETERALRLAAQHQRQFPVGALISERRALRLTALCALGRHTQAVTEAKALVRDDPRSPLGRRIANGCPKQENSNEDHRIRR